MIHNAQIYLNLKVFDVTEQQFLESVDTMIKLKKFAIFLI